MTANSVVSRSKREGLSKGGQVENNEVQTVARLCGVHINVKKLLLACHTYPINSFLRIIIPRRINCRHFKIFQVITSWY